MTIKYYESDRVDYCDPWILLGEAVVLQAIEDLNALKSSGELVKGGRPAKRRPRKHCEGYRTKVDVLLLSQFFTRPMNYNGIGWWMKAVCPRISISAALDRLGICRIDDQKNVDANNKTKQTRRKKK